jgi:WD40 repeat protein
MELAPGKEMTAMRLQTAMTVWAMLSMTAAEGDLFARQPIWHEEPSARTDSYGDPLPKGAIARLGSVRLRAAGAPCGLAPDGKTIITVFSGWLVQFWDAESGKLLRQRVLPGSYAYRTYLSADGRLLAAQEEGVDRPIEIWDVAAGKRLHKLRLPQLTGIYRETFSPDGKTYAVSQTGGGKPIVRLWDMASGKQRELTGHRSSADSLVFSPDCKLLAASDRRSVICWDLARNEQLWQIKDAFGVSLGFTPDGRTLLASPGSREQDWHAWTARTGKPAEGLKLPSGYNYASFSIAPDGRTLVFVQSRGVAGSDGLIRLWDVQTGKLLHTLKAKGGIGPFFPDGKSFLTNDGCLQRWELATGKPLFPAPDKLGHQAEVSRLVYSPDGQRLASAASDSKICLWDIATAKPLHILSGSDRLGADLVFTPDGRCLVSGVWGFQGALDVWDTETGKEVRSIPLFDSKRGERQQNVSRVYRTPDGRTLIVLGYDPTGGPSRMKFMLSQWDLETGKQKSRVDATIEMHDSLYGDFAVDGRSLVCSGKILDTATGKMRVKLEGGPSPLSHYTFSSDGRLVAGFRTHTLLHGNRISTHMDGIEIWDAATGRSRQFIPTDWVGQLAFSPDGRYLAAADLQGIRLWERATEQVVLKHKAHEQKRGSYGHSFASSLCMAPDGRTLATGHPDTTILIWSMVPSIRPATGEDLPRLWADLIASDAAKAYAAVWRLSDAGNEAIRFLRERLRPVSPVAAEHARRLLADLDSDDFSKREAAAGRLRELDDRVASFLREKLKERPALEMRRRVEELLAHLEKPPSGETLRILRALAVLEHIGTPEAQQILKTLARGLTEARITREAISSLERFSGHHPVEKH